MEVGIGNGFEKRQEEMWMKELHSWKTQIVVQMVPTQASHAPESPFKDLESVPALVIETMQGDMFDFTQGSYWSLVRLLISTCIKTDIDESCLLHFM